MTASNGGRRLWIVNHHATLPSKDQRSGRHLAFAQHLRPHGWETTLFVSSTTHPSGEQRLGGRRLRRRATEEGVDTVWVRTPAYGSSMARRLVGMLVFAVAVLLPGTTRGVPRPDIVMGSTVHPFAAWAGWMLARRHRVPFVFEIRDVWPETLIDLGQISATSPAARLMSRLARALCARADLVVSPLPGIRAYLDEQGLTSTPFSWVSNGVESERADDASTAAPGDAGPFTFMYLGAHGNANALETLLRAFDSAHRRSPGVDMRFRLVGDGPRKPELQRIARSLDAADLIRFEERIPRSAVLERARQSDCLVANMYDRPVYRYGIGLNKLFDYLLAGRPVVFASSAPRDPIRDADAGWVVPADDLEAIAEAMVRMCGTDGDARRAMGERGRAHVLANYTYPALSEKLGADLEALLDRQAGR